MKSFLFDVGNSSAGPVGFCARVTAPDRAAAVSRLRELLPDAVHVGGQAGAEYLTVYLNRDAITAEDIYEEDAAS